MSPPAQAKPAVLSTLPSSEITLRIRTAIRKADALLLAQHPYLGRNDQMAIALFVGALGLAAGGSAAWTAGLLSAPLTICLIAFAISILHELEHDLIHDIYLPQPRLRLLVLTVIWLAKASLDPWSRGRLHRWHHAVSGQAEDIEERLIGLGLPWGPLRLLLTFLAPVSLLLGPSIMRSVKRRAKEGGGRPDLKPPPGWWMIHSVTILIASIPFIAVGGLIAGAVWPWPLLVLWILPNTLRHAAIVIMSANSHYVGIKRNVLVEQNQIIDHPLFWPLQLFCWNFGATHVVHHFLVRQPFWRRTLIFKQVRSTLVDHGVPLNDLATFRRANRRPHLT